MEAPEPEVAYENRYNHSRKTQGALPDSGAAGRPAGGVGSGSPQVEKGTTYPDITTLPALARVLHTDLNTLLSFQEDLTAEEIAHFTDDLDRLVREEGYEAAFQRGMDEIHQYPNCEALIYSVVFYLDGARFLYGLPNPDDYTDRLMPFYDTMSHSQTPEIRDAALSMCIAYHATGKTLSGRRNSSTRFHPHTLIRRNSWPRSTPSRKSGRMPSDSGSIEFYRAPRSFRRR